MPKSDFIPQNDDAFAAQLQTFKTAIPTYAATLGLTSAQTTEQAADADYFGYVLACHSIMRNGSQQWTGWKQITRDGGDVPSSGEGELPVFPTKATAVAPGVEPRFRELVRQIKSQPNYNPSIGEALGIEGAEQTGPDMTTVEPDIGAKISGGAVAIKWGWGGHREFLSMCELQVDRGNGTFVLLAIDTTPNYTDTEPFPATPTKWTYRAIYRVGDHRVGQWSKPVSVTVGG